jgi:hypothetical protein
MFFWNHIQVSRFIVLTQFRIGSSTKICSTLASLQSAIDTDESKLAVEKEKMHDIDKIIANRNNINQDATPESLTVDEKSKFAISPDKSGLYTYKLVISSSNWKSQVIASGSVVIVDGERVEPSAPTAVWTDGPFLSEDECAMWIKRAEEEGLETGDISSSKAMEAWRG